jgi:hypothetical protein
MNPATAQSIVDALDVELAKRRGRKLDALIASWTEEDGEASLYGFCRHTDQLG